MKALVLRLYRITAIILWSAITAVLSMPSQFTSGWAGIRKVTYTSRLWSKGLARIINLRVKIYGDIPSGAGGLVVSNHLGYIDILLHGSILPLRHAPKADIAGWPVLGWYIALSKPIWVDRTSRQASKKIFADYAETMKNGMFLIVYPEGTSTDGNNGILDFKAASFEAAITSGAPVFPVVTRYKETAGGPKVPWYGDMSLLPHAWDILKLPYIDAELHFLPPVIPSGKTRKELASSVRELMLEKYDSLR